MTDCNSPPMVAHYLEKTQSLRGKFRLMPDLIIFSRASSAWQTGSGSGARSTMVTGSYQAK